MPGTFEFGEKIYTLTDIFASRYDITGNTYNVVQTCAAAQQIKVEAEADNDKLSGSGAYLALLSVIRGAKVNFGQGAIDRSVFTEITGASNATSNSAPSQIARMRLQAGGSGLPYFGIIGTGPTDDGGLFAVGLQCVKLDTFPAFTLDGKTNKFNMAETGGYAVAVLVSGSNDLIHTKVYQLASSFVAPASAANFLAFFTGTA